METCPKCGVQMELGDWPFCPHGRGGMTVIGDDIEGGQIFENGFSTPQRFYSHSAHRAALDREGFQIAPRYVENNTVGMVRWDTVDLEAAKVLVQRGAEARREGKKLLEPHPDHPITVSDAGWKVGR